MFDKSIEMCDWTNRIATAQQTDGNCCGCQCACIPHELFIEPISVCRQTYQSRAFYLHVNCVLICWLPIEWTNACECCVFVYMRAVSLHFIFICVRFVYLFVVWRRRRIGLWTIWSWNASQQQQWMTQPASTAEALHNT